VSDVDEMYRRNRDAVRDLDNDHQRARLLHYLLGAWHDDERFQQSVWDGIAYILDDETNP
jgi:hypothetical protein